MLVSAGPSWSVLVTTGQSRSMAQKNCKGGGGDWLFETYSVKQGVRGGWIYDKYSKYLTKNTNTKDYFQNKKIPKYLTVQARVEGIQTSGRGDAAKCYYQGKNTHAEIQTQTQIQIKIQRKHPKEARAVWVQTGGRDGGGLPNAINMVNTNTNTNINNKLASLEATLVRNSGDPLTDGGEV